MLCWKYSSLLVNHFFPFCCRPSWSMISSSKLLLRNNRSSGISFQDRNHICNYVLTSSFTNWVMTPFSKVIDWFFRQEQPPPWPRVCQKVVLYHPILWGTFCILVLLMLQVIRTIPSQMVTSGSGITSWGYWCGWFFLNVNACFCPRGRLQTLLWCPPKSSLKGLRGVC